MKNGVENQQLSEGCVRPKLKAISTASHLHTIALTMPPPD